MRWVTVREWERAVRFRDGVLVGELNAGRHRQSRRAEIRVIDLRPRWLTVAQQEIPTAGGIQVRVGAVVRWSVERVTDYVRAAAKPADELHVAVQLALRAAVIERTHEVLDAQRAEIGAAVAAAIADRAAELGVLVQEVAVRDVALPVELRRAALAELVARAEGRAVLERTRAETAALRSLANAADLAERHPHLLQLRTLQAATQPGATVVLERPR